jgi:hypothetical protein
VLEWITGIDHWNRNERESADGNRDDGAWAAFLEEHPELFELEVRAGKARDS